MPCEVGRGSFATLAAILHVEDLDFIRIDFGDVGARATSSRNSFRMGGTDPGFDGATADKGHLKHCAVIRWRTVVEFVQDESAVQIASASVSPVRTRSIWPRPCTKILPSPIFPVFADEMIVSMILST
jgi:hypothetical protein